MERNYNMDINNMNKPKDMIDLGLFGRIILEKKKIIVSIIILCTIISIIVSFMLPKVYQSTTLVQIKTTPSTPITSLGAAVGIDVSDNNSNNNSPETYIALMQSREVIQPIIDQMDISDEAKAKMNVAGFVKANLEITNTKKTNLITINAYGKTPDEAQMIAQAIPENLNQLLSKLNKQGNADNLKFLEEKVAEAKKTMETAENKLSAYQQEKKIYSPDEQAKAIIDSLNKYDNSIAQLQAEADGNSAKLSGVTAQLEQQNADLLKYNVSDNANIGNLRESIVNKQVELVGLEQRFTNEHPDVIRVKEELATLRNSLDNEIASAVNSQSVTLSPVQSNLLQQKLDAETKVAIDNASLEALKSKQASAENTISTLSSDSVEYVRLDREAKIASNVYTALVENYEQTKVQESKNIMDVQIVDTADLPREDMPAKPNKKLIVLLGFAIGIVVAIGYTLIIYRKEN